MDTRKILIITIAVIVSLIAFLYAIRYVLFVIFFASSYSNKQSNYSNLNTKLKGEIILSMTDSLKTEEWKYNLPEEWRFNLSKNIPSFDRGRWYFINDDDLRHEFVLEILGSNVIYLHNAYKDSMRLSIHDNKTELENIFRETVLKDIEQEALKRNIPKSEIYLTKEEMKEFGFDE